MRKVAGDVASARDAPLGRTRKDIVQAATMALNPRIAMARRMMNGS